MKATVFRPGLPLATIDCVELSETTLFFLKLCAAHDGVSERELLTRLICARCDAIGLAGLLDRFEAGAANAASEAPVALSKDEKAGSVPEAPGTRQGDVHAVPEFRRANVRRASAADEFRGAG